MKNIKKNNHKELSTEEARVHANRNILIKQSMKISFTDLLVKTVGVERIFISIHTKCPSCKGNMKVYIGSDFFRCDSCKARGRKNDFVELLLKDYSKELQ